MGTLTGLAEQEIDRVDWGTLREAAGSARNIGPALRRLLAAPTTADVTSAYWELENHVVVQGELFEAAAAAVSVLVASLADPRPSHIRIAVLDLLYQVLSGKPSQIERDRGLNSLADECHARAREGFWLIVQQLSGAARDAALDVLRQLGYEDARVQPFVRPSGD